MDGCLVKSAAFCYGKSMKLESTLTGKVSRMAPDSQPGALESLDLFLLVIFLRIRTRGKSLLFIRPFFSKRLIKQIFGRFFPPHSGILVTSDGLVGDSPLKRGLTGILG